METLILQSELCRLGFSMYLFLSTLTALIIFTNKQSNNQTNKLNTSLNTTNKKIKSSLIFENRNQKEHIAFTPTTYQAEC